MPYVDGETLRQLRNKLGISPEDVAGYIAVSPKTIRKYEKEGTTKRGYVLMLLELIENPRGNIMPQARGRPRKPWTLAQPHRHSDFGEMRVDADDGSKAYFRLWYPGHPEHLRAIVNSPTQSGLMWLERRQLGTFEWKRYRRLPDGTAQFLDNMLADKDKGWITKS